MTSPLSARSSLPSHMSSVPDPSTDRPTVWAAPSAADTDRTSGRNVLALVSLLASLVFPLAVAINLLGAVAVANHYIPERAMMVVVTVGGGLGTLGIPAMLTAIATGHVALVIAKRFSRRAARRWMAIVGLIVGYMSLLAVVGVMALFIIAGMNGF
ncbi:MAG TPA: hypothetical protein VFW17_13335 [Ktedonobacterales bacterium]|jgi:hypothetical protein|nr:hypothetical protein [Ktedonobacterales bacterium]